MNDDKEKRTSPVLNAVCTTLSRMYVVVLVLVLVLALALAPDMLLLRPGGSRFSNIMAFEVASIDGAWGWWRWRLSSPRFLQACSQASFGCGVQ